MKNEMYLKCFIGLLTLLFLVSGSNDLRVVAQESLRWTQQSRVPGGDPLVNTPYLIADQNQIVHVFNSVWMAGRQMIVYSQWTLDQGWTDPIDILLPQLGDQNRLHGVILDKLGIVHLLFFSGDDLAANIYYAAAPLDQAGSAHAWSKPIIVGEQANTPDEAAFVMNSKNQLFVLYRTDSAGIGLYFTTSTDRGATWSMPKPMFLTYDSELFPFYLQMYVDNNDGVHALWNVNNISGSGEAFYFAKLGAGQIEWNEPIEFSAGGLNQPAIVEYEDELILIYHADSEDGLTRYMRQSQDGGNTWTEKKRLFPHVGSNGAPSLVIDSNNTLHMIFGNRVTVNGVQIQGMWHSVFLEGGWSNPEAVVSGPRVVDEIGGEGFDPSFANAIVSQGNVILATWRSDPGAGENGVWYSYTILDAPELPMVPLPSTFLSTRMAPTPLAMEISAPSVPTYSPISDTLENIEEGDNPGPAYPPAMPVVISIFFALSVLVVVVLVRQLKHH